MSVRFGLMALLAEHPMYGYQLRQEFESRTGGTWPLNIGQVYTTLARLERDGLVAEGERRDDGCVIYQLTPKGHAQTATWWTTPVDRGAPARDELAIKLALAVTAPAVDVAAVIQRQRTESMRSLQEYTRLAARATDPDRREDLAWLLVLDNLVFAAEAEIRWLDHVEQRLARTERAAPLAYQADGGRQAQDAEQQEAGR
jgi:DNA-binding PadR family transcriptional regulator